VQNDQKSSIMAKGSPICSSDCLLRHRRHHSSWWVVGEYSNFRSAKASYNTTS
ncbi:hypothetical protein KQX54_013824, partial [Cotesia glomerata]